MFLNHKIIIILSKKLRYNFYYPIYLEPFLLSFNLDNSHFFILYPRVVVVNLLVILIPYIFYFWFQHHCVDCVDISKL